MVLLLSSWSDLRRRVYLWTRYHLLDVLGRACDCVVVQVFDILRVRFLFKIGALDGGAINLILTVRHSWWSHHRVRLETAKILFRIDLIIDAKILHVESLSLLLRLKILNFNCERILFRRNDKWILKIRVKLKRLRFWLMTLLPWW